MEPEFWHDRWLQGQIGFHQPAVGARLRRHWPELGLPRGARVLVPLCGKSLDLRWLAEQGHEVTGVELSPLACRAFFEEQGWTPTVTEAGAHVRWSANGVTILQGDVFDLPPGPLADAIYDRAATVALPPDVRTRYAARLAEALPDGAPMLLVVLDRVQPDRAGPPFAVDADEVRRLYGGAFELQRLAHDEEPAPPGATVPTLGVDTWRLVRRAPSGG